MQRSDGRSDTDASTAANGTESATEKYILGSKLEEIHLGEGRSHDGSFLKDFVEGWQENCILSIRVEFAKLLGIHSVNLHVVGELTLADSYQGIELSWRIFFNKSIGRESFELRSDRRHKDLVYNSYLPFVETTTKEKTIREVHTYSHSFDTWETKSLENHSTFETIAITEELKRGLIHDLDRFIQRKYFYYRVRRPWTRNYLLCGPPGTGKTSLVAAMAKYLNLESS
ncbi:hypothetical protein F2Q68_00011466 [Brassica cretica]|uniref:ATPase AAA-type core domain-containing protein n=1 Tax=Brassica cretica TaxID=69181 RepID=A0A8S9KQW2_BRACR|nr:hypothetical protein F2Q68_00011466 [Brassica cretica]